MSWSVEEMAVVLFCRGEESQFVSRCMVEMVPSFSVYPEDRTHKPFNYWALGSVYHLESTFPSWGRAPVGHVVTVVSAGVAWSAMTGLRGPPGVLTWLSGLVQMNVSPASLAGLFEEEFKQDMAALKVRVVYPSAKGSGS